MIARGVILDSTNNEPLPGASAVVVDRAGVNLGVGMAASGDGTFKLDSALLDQGNQLMISNVSYQTAIVDPDVFSASSGYVPIKLVPDGSLSAVTVTPPKINWLGGLLVLTGFVGAVFAIPVKKKKRGRHV